MQLCFCPLLQIDFFHKGGGEVRGGSTKEYLQNEFGMPSITRLCSTMEHYPSSKFIWNLVWPSIVSLHSYEYKVQSMNRKILEYVWQFEDFTHLNNSFHRHFGNLSLRFFDFANFHYFLSLAKNMLEWVIVLSHGIVFQKGATFFSNQKSFTPFLKKKHNERWGTQLWIRV
jgi:hypothetical protein